jgi:predicted acylesterase/phospholipase RssA
MQSSDSRSPVADTVPPFFHIGVLAKIAEHGLLRRIEVISTVSGGSIIGALYYLHAKNLLEDKPDAEITDNEYIQLIRQVEHEYRLAAASNVRARIRLVCLTTASCASTKRRTR